MVQGVVTFWVLLRRLARLAKRHNKRIEPKTNPFCVRTPAGRRSAVDRPKRDQEGGSAFVRIRLLWRLAKRAKRLSKTQNGTTP